MNNLSNNTLVLDEDYNDTGKARPTMAGDTHLSLFLITTQSGLPETRPSIGPNFYKEISYSLRCGIECGRDDPAQRHGHVPSPYWISL